MAEFQQNRFTRGVAAGVFEMRRLEELNIRTFSFRFKTMKMQKRYKFVPGKMFSGIKIDFSRVLLDSRGKYRIAMTCFILERKFL